MSFDLKTSKTPNVGGPLKKPSLVVVHFTAGGTLKGAVDWLCDKRSHASAHVVVGRDGATQQLVPIDRISWHAGSSVWRGRPGVNGYSIGLELVNFGPLRKAPDGTFRSIVGSAVVPPEDVFHGQHKFPEVGAYEHWQRYPQAQIEALDKLVSELFAELPSLREVAGHDDVAQPKGRKSDPGPAFTEFMIELQSRYNR